MGFGFMVEALSGSLWGWILTEHLKPYINTFWAVHARVSEQNEIFVYVSFFLLSKYKKSSQVKNK